MTFQDLKNESTYEFHDISSEEYRQYVFLGKGTLTINSPIAVAVSKSGHRILDADGVSHFVPSEWQMIHWKAKNGQPHFVK